MLEGLACRLAAENRSASDTRLSTLERTFDRTFDGTAKSYLHYNEQFHRLIVQMAGNTELARLVENLADSIVHSAGACVGRGAFNQARAGRA